MLSKKKIIIPENLIHIAKKTPFIPVGIVCAGQQSTMDSLKKAYEIGLINPIFIGQRSIINEEAKKLDWNIKNFTIIDKSSEKESAIAGTLLAAENKIKVLIKGNIHTDTLMKIYLKKEFGLIGSKRLSHIWHMSLNTNDKPLFITDGALNVAPRLDVKMHILKNAIEFANKTGIDKQETSVSPSEIQNTLEGKDNLDENIKGYEDFLKIIQPLIQNNEIKNNDLIEQLKIGKNQFNKWIKKGVEDHKID